MREVTGEKRWMTKFPYAFGNPPNKKSGSDPSASEGKPGPNIATLEADGLPAVGTELKYGDAYYSYVHSSNPDTPIVKKYNKSEPAFVEQVKVGLSCI